MKRFEKSWMFEIFAGFKYSDPSSHQNEKRKNEKGHSHQPNNEFQTTRTGGKKGQLPLPRCTDSWYEFTLTNLLSPLPTALAMAFLCMPIPRPK